MEAAAIAEVAAALAAAEAAAACCLATRTVVVRKPGIQNLVRYVVAVVEVGVFLMRPSLLCRNWPRALMLDVPHHTAARWRLMLTTACVDRKA